jgi:hypothetical protein
MDSLSQKKSPSVQFWDIVLRDLFYVSLFIVSLLLLAAIIFVILNATGVLVWDFWVVG